MRLKYLAVLLVVFLLQHYGVARAMGEERTDPGAGVGLCPAIDLRQEAPANASADCDDIPHLRASFLNRAAAGGDGH